MRHHVTLPIFFILLSLPPLIGNVFQKLGGINQFFDFLNSNR